MQPVHAAMSARVALVHVGVGDHVGDREPSARPQHPGGLADHRGLSPDRLITQFEMTTSTLASGERDVLDVALEELDVLDARLAALARASSSISSVMSSPIARPVGPTRRAEISTSAPAPDPRSRTVSPSCSSATAVGTPQPSDALIAASGARSRRCRHTARAEHAGASVGSQQRAPGGDGHGRGRVPRRTVSRTCSTVAVAATVGPFPAEQPHPARCVSPQHEPSQTARSTSPCPAGSALGGQLSQPESSFSASGIT